MKKITKFLGIILVLLIAVLVCAGFFLDSIVERFRPQIQAGISKSVGRPVTIGAIESQIFPSVAITVSNVAVSGASGASVSSLALKTSIGELLSGDISVSQLGLEGVELNIERAADGSLSVAGIPMGKKEAMAQSSNSANAPAASGTQQAPAQAQPTAEPAADDDGSFSLKVRSADIKGVNITFIDNAVNPKQTIEVKDLSAELKDIDTAGKANIDLTATLLGTSANNIRLYGELGNPLANFPINATVELNSLDLKRLASLANAYGTDSSKLQLDDSLSMTFSVQTVTGGISINGLIDGEDAQIAYGEVFKKPSGDALRVDSSVLATLAGTAKADKMSITLGGNTINAPFSFSPNSTIDGKLNTQSFNLSELASYIPMLEQYALGGSVSTNLDVSARIGEKNASPKAVGSIVFSGVKAQAPIGAEEGAEPRTLPLDELNGEINFSEGEKIRTKDLKAIIAGQTLALKIGAASFIKPKFVFNISSDSLEFGPIANALGPSADSLKNSFIKKLAVDGSYSTSTGSGQVALSSGPASLSDVPLDGLDVKTSITKDLVSVLPSTVEIFGGKLNAGAKLTRGQQQLLTLALSGGGMDAERVSDAFLKSSPVGLRGNISNLKTNLKTNLASPLPTAGGSSTVVMVDGAITGVNVIGQTFNAVDSIPGINSGLAAFVPEEHAAVLSGTETAFSDLTIDTLIGNSQLQLKTLRLTHPLYLITGTGNIGLEGSMKIRAQLRLTPALSTKMVLKEPKLKLLQDRNQNMVIPIEIIKKEGRVVVIPDAEELAKRAATNTAKEAAGRALDKVAPGVGGIVDSLF